MVAKQGLSLRVDPDKKDFAVETGLRSKTSTDAESPGYGSLTGFDASYRSGRDAACAFALAGCDAVGLDEDIRSGGSKTGPIRAAGYVS